MSDNFNHDKFFKSTLSQIENNLTKFIFETNFSNVQSLYLRNQISQFKKKSFRRNNSQNELTSHYSNITQKILPLLKNKRDPSARHKNSSIFNPKAINENIITGKQDINNIMIKDSLKNEIKQIINKKKYMKYSNENLNQKLYHTQLLDKNRNTIIRNKDIEKGLYDLINKGYIPKDADVTPAFNKEGNPFNITSKNINYNYKKSKNKDEIANATLNRFIFKPQYDLNVFYNTYQPVYKKIDIKKNYEFKSIQENKRNNKSNLFLTSSDKKDNEKNNNDLCVDINDILSTKKENQKEKFFTSNITMPKNLFNKLYPRNVNNVKISSRKKNFYNYIKDINLENNIIIKYEYYELIMDDKFNQFKNENIENWCKIENILGNFSILLEKLNINHAEIDSNKILKLIEYYNDEIKYITNKDLLMCLTEKDLKSKGFDPENEKILYFKIKEAFIIRIQRKIRKMLAIKQYKYMKIVNKNSIIIQKYFRRYIKSKNIIYELEHFKNEIHKKYIEIFNNFKKDWNNNQDKLRIEIHINSLSYDSYNNCKIDKFILKESLQLNRLIRLIDPNLEIIYILPFNLSEEILSYYYSTLKTVGIENIEKKIHFLIPEASEYLPNNYSLSKLLYLSPKTLNQIKILTRNKYPYIIPGIVSPMEEYLSYILEIPILMGNLNKINLIFNKSGIKSTLEMNDIPFPISAWDIKSIEEFYSSLAHLIATYPAIRVWIMKANNDINGETVAYLDTSKIELINQLKKEKKNDKNFTVELFQEKLFYQLKNIVVKNVVYCYPNFYHNWNEYLVNFLNNKGIIEACPTKGLDGIMGIPCIPLLIEPNGKIKILPTFEKINANNFKNIICTSPQNNIDNSILNQLGQKLGLFLYHQEIIGYVTIECITFHDGKKVLFWCTDLKYGLTQTICDIQYGYFLYIQGNININKFEEKFFGINDNKNINNINEINNNEIINTNNSQINTSIINDKNYNQLLSNAMVFSIPFISTDIIKNIKLKHLLRDFRYENIVFDIEKKEGIIFNLCDGLECGIFGIVGIINNDGYERINPNYKIWKLIEQTMNVLKNIVYKINKKSLMSTINKQVFGSPERTDIIELHLIFSRIKKIMKLKENEFEKEEKRRKKIANEPYL